MNGEITKIVETSLYVHDLETSERFYTDVLKLRVHSRTPGRDVFLKAGKNMLLLFNPVFLREEAVREGKNAIPQVYEHGRTHIAFEIERGSLDDWARRLEEKGVRITHRETWETGIHCAMWPAGITAPAFCPKQSVVLLKEK